MSSFPPPQVQAVEAVEHRYAAPCPDRREEQAGRRGSGQLALGPGRRVATRTTHQESRALRAALHAQPAVDDIVKADRQLTINVQACLHPVRCVALWPCVQPDHRGGGLEALPELDVPPQEQAVQGPAGDAWRLEAALRRSTRLRSAGAGASGPQGDARLPRQQLIRPHGGQLQAAQLHPARQRRRGGEGRHHGVSQRSGGHPW